MAGLVDQVKDMLDNIQQSLFDLAKQKRDACIQVVHTWEEFAEALSQKKMILAPWCDEEVRFLSFNGPKLGTSFIIVLKKLQCLPQEVEKDVKTRTKGEMGAAKSLCSPFDQPALPEGTVSYNSVNDLLQ